MLTWVLVKFACDKSDTFNVECISSVPGLASCCIWVWGKTINLQAYRRIALVPHVVKFFQKARTPLCSKWSVDERALKYPLSSRGKGKASKVEAKDQAAFEDEDEVDPEDEDEVDSEDEDEVDNEDDDPEYTKAMLKFQGGFEIQARSLLAFLGLGVLSARWNTSKVNLSTIPSCWELGPRYVHQGSPIHAGIGGGARGTSVADVIGIGSFVTHVHETLNCNCPQHVTYVDTLTGVSANADDQCESLQQRDTVWRHCALLGHAYRGQLQGRFCSCSHSACVEQCCRYCPGLYDCTANYKSLAYGICIYGLPGL